jgi:peptidoglycan biosynthesis protein MviN/MurJ (putative lipid II flippase)
MATAGIAYVLMCELGHFLLAFISGMIAWLLMTTAYNWLYARVGDYQPERNIDPITRGIMKNSGTLILMMAIVVGVLSHVLEDYYINIV